MDIYTAYAWCMFKYRVLKKVPLTFIDDKNSKIQGKCIYDTTGDYIENKKHRTKEIIPKEIIIYNIGDVILTLLHEVSHAVTLHYERKVKGEYLYIEHSHLFYENYLDLATYAYDNKIIDKKINITNIKFIDKNG